MSFKDIFCQDKAIDALQRAFISNRLANAYIFAGPEGIGKFKTALEWAKLLLCKTPVIENNAADSCGTCQSCQLFEAGSHPDFNHVYKELKEFTEDGKGKAPPIDLPISVIREFLIEKASIKPSLSKGRVFVVSEAEKLNASSQNSLLKILEEPPEHCRIILLCTCIDKLLPTTKSRSQIIQFASIAENRIIENLREVGLDENRSRYFAFLSQGSLGIACQWAKLELADANLYQIKKELIDSLVDCEYPETLDLAAELLNKTKKIATIWADIDKATSKADINRRVNKTLVKVAISALHDAMKLNISKDYEIINFDQQEQIKKLAARFDSELLAEKISDCFMIQQWIESSVNEKLVFEHLLLNIIDSDKMLI